MSKLSEETLDAAIMAYDDVYHAQYMSNGATVHNHHEAMRAAILAALIAHEAGASAAERMRQKVEAILLDRANKCFSRADQLVGLHEGSEAALCGEELAGILDVIRALPTDGE